VTGRKGEFFLEWGAILIFVEKKSFESGLMAILRTSWNSHQNNWCVNAFVPGGMVPFLPLDHTGPHGGAMPDQKA
jgi:hypothetical protein